MGHHDGEYRRSHRYCYVGVALVFALLALVALCVSFTTDHWLHYDVDRETIKNANPTQNGYTQLQFNKLMTEDSKFFTRRRGLLRTCYCDNTTWVFKEAENSDKDGNCLREIAYDFEDIKIDSLNQTTHETDIFKLSRNLMRCHLAFFILAIVLLAIAIIAATVGCWCQMITAFIVACVACFLGALVLLLGMVFFHWYKYLEENEVDFDFYGRKAWHQEPVLDANTSVKYHYSYACGWIAFAFCFLAFIFFSLAAWSTNRKKEQEGAGIVKPVKEKQSQPQAQRQAQPQPQQMMAPQQNTSQDGTVYVINHYPSRSTERLVPKQQPQVVQQPTYPTQPVYNQHTVYQSALPPGVTNFYA